MTPNPENTSKYKVVYNPNLPRCRAAFISTTDVSGGSWYYDMYRSALTEKEKEANSMAEIQNKTRELGGGLQGTHDPAVDPVEPTSIHLGVHRIAPLQLDQPPRETQCGYLTAAMYAHARADGFTDAAMLERVIAYELSTSAESRACFMQIVTNVLNRMHAAAKDSQKKKEMAEADVVEKQIEAIFKKERDVFTMPQIDKHAIISQMRETVETLKKAFGKPAEPAGDECHVVESKEPS